MPPRRRLDAELVRRGVADSRASAARLIEAGQVLVAGAPADKPARLVSPDEPLQLVGPPPRFVGRGGEKLDAALVRFGIDVRGRAALDAGASTGGFTDCLLQAGAERVVAVDVGRGQLRERLRADPRVEVRERTDIRSVPSSGERYPLIVADLSFISVRSVAAPLVALAQPGADIVVLVKPQFEAGRAEVSRGKGVIRDPEVWRRALEEAITAMEDAGAANMGVMVSPLRGADGNVEFLAWFRAGPAAVDSATADPSATLEARVAAVVRVAAAETTGSAE
ncbi:MAG TPA: TlyA family RNA methyltransferase [Acidimicrobiales bacterium]|nr:TlyA family RNA methyltransferase [Acidimicrobiales bacterium]